MTVIVPAGFPSTITTNRNVRSGITMNRMNVTISNVGTKKNDFEEID